MTLGSHQASSVSRVSLPFHAQTICSIALRAQAVMHATDVQIWAKRISSSDSWRPPGALWPACTSNQHQPITGSNHQLALIEIGTSIGQSSGQHKASIESIVGTLAVARSGELLPARHAYRFAHFIGLIKGKQIGSHYICSISFFFFRFLSTFEKSLSYATIHISN